MTARRALAVVLVVLACTARGGLATGLPTNVCHEGACGESQAAVWARFQRATGLSPHAVPGVYSGRCWHNAGSIDRDRAHHGGVLLDHRGGRPVFDGRFAFFRKSQPYAHLDLAGARVLFPSAFALEVHATHAVAENFDGFAPFRYWLREEPAGGRLLLVGYFGFDHTVLCELARNGP